MGNKLPKIKIYWPMNPGRGQ